MLDATDGERSEHLQHTLILLTADALLPASMGGGFVARIARCPFDVVKTKLQAQIAMRGQADYLHF